jgi:flagellar motor switch protein FliN/FliY
MSDNDTPVTQEPEADMLDAQAPEYAYDEAEPEDGAVNEGEDTFSAPSADGAGENVIDVHPMLYASFEGDTAPRGEKNSMELVYDIPLQVSVELGKTHKEISEILEFGLGTIIVLDKLAGDPVEVLANGKLIAKGEVVVIDENYGVRITEIING